MSGRRRYDRLISTGTDIVSIVENVDSERCGEFGDALERLGRLKEFGWFGDTVAAVAELGSSSS